MENVRQGPVPTPLVNTGTNASEGLTRLIADKHTLAHQPPPSRYAAVPFRGPHRLKLRLVEITQHLGDKGSPLSTTFLACQKGLPTPSTHF